MIDNISKVYEDFNYDAEGLPVKKTRYEGDNGVVDFYTDGYLFQRSFVHKGKEDKMILYNPDGSEMSKQDRKKWERDQEKLLEEKREKYRARLPEFPGGDAAFYRYIEKNVRWPSSWTSKPSDEIQFMFLLNKDGKVTDVKLLNTTNSELIDAITNVLKQMPAFNMKGYISYSFTRKLVFKY